MADASGRSAPSSRPRHTARIPRAPGSGNFPARVRAEVRQRAGAGESDSDIRRYPEGSPLPADPGAISGTGKRISAEELHGELAVSDSGERISAEGPVQRQDGGDSDGYQDRATDGRGDGWVSQEEFYAEQPLYQETDFESIDEYLIHLEDQWRKRNGLKPLKAEGARPPTLDQKGGRQVGLRLPGEEYERLAELSERNGVAPATMARILVVRALRADDALAEVNELIDG